MSTIRIPVSKPCLSPLEHKLVRGCLARNELTQGLMVARFERELAEYLGVRHVVATTSGTTALHLALVALGIGPGDEVLVPDLTFVATANAVRYTGATVVLVDVDPATWCIDAAEAARKVTPRTKAIIPVHLYGVPAAYSIDKSLFVIEDCAEALGGHYPTSKAMPSLSCDCGVFSFYANKVLTCGEGGAVATNNSQLDWKLRHLRGQALTSQRYFHDQLGFNYRMTELQAAIGVGQLSHLEEMLVARRRVIARYAEHLMDPDIASWSWHAPCAQFEHNAPWQFTFTVPTAVSRNALVDYLLNHGIETRPAFQPLHRMPMYHFNHYGVNLIDEDYPHSSRIADTGLSLPTYADLPLSAVDEISQLVLDFVASQASKIDNKQAI